MRKLLLSLIVLSMTQSIHGQEKPTKESRKRDADAVEQRIVKKREEIKLKREANLKERKIRQLELEKENQRQYEELLKKHK
jgi:hypothetical protein